MSPWPCNHLFVCVSYNSVANTVISTVRKELASRIDYKVVTTGHSLGGSLAALGAVSLKANFPEADITIYTYGKSNEN